MSISTTIKTALLCTCVLTASAQTHRFPHIDVVTALPSGACTPANTLEQYNGDLYTCDPNTHLWRVLTGGGGGGGTPGGSSLSLQYNASGAFGGSTGLTYDLSTNGMGFSAYQAAQGTLKNMTGSVTLYPEWFGAVGDGSHDDTAALNAAFSACPVSGNCTVKLSSKNYLITAMVDAGSTTTSNVTGRSLIGDGIGATKITCSPSGTIEACVRFKNSPQSTFTGMTVSANANATYAVEHTTTGSSEYQSLSDVLIGGGQYAWGIGPDTHLDLAHIIGKNVVTRSGVIANIVAGDGTQGNVLDNYCYGCTADVSGGDGVLIRGGGFQAPDMSFDENTGIDWHITVPGDNQIVFAGSRSEGSKEFFKYSGVGVGFPKVHMTGVTWGCAASHNTYAVENNSGNSISIIDSHFYCTDNNVQFNFGLNSTNPTHVFMRNVGVSNHSWGTLMQGYANSNTVVLDSANDIYTDPNSFVDSVGSGLNFKTGSPIFTQGAITSDSIGNLNAAGAIAALGNVSNSVGGFGTYQNLVTYSQFDPASLGAQWFTGCTAPNPPTLTANTVDVPDPFGNNFALKVVSQAVGGTGCGGIASLLQQTITYTAGQSYTLSVWLRGATGTEQGFIADNASNGNQLPIPAIKNSWVRYHLTFIANAGSIQFVLALNPSETVYVFGAQIENSSALGIYAHSTSVAVSPTQGFLSQGNPIVQALSGQTTNYLPKATSPTASTGPSVVEDIGTGIKIHGSGASTTQTGTNTFSALAACAAGTEGTRAPVTDSATNTWGATITGGGTNHVYAYCDGSAWTVMAK